MTRPKKSAPAPLAFSYLRFSSAKQSDGDTLTRQTELRDRWLEKSGATLDTSLKMSDPGVSAFTGAHRKNPDRHALAAFLRLVEQGRIPRGSYLIVESLDRLTREHIRPALTLFLNLIEAGIRVVQLLPVETVYDEDVEPMTLMMAIMELNRGHSESKMKSERLSSAWRAKKKLAREGVVMSRMVPCWLRVRGGRFVVVEAAAAAVRRAYRLATEGHGITAITRKLNAEKAPAPGRSGHWQRAFVSTLLRTRKVIGEYQPRTGRTRAERKPDGPPVPNYYPAIVTEDEWNAARFALTKRRKLRTREGKRVNLFVGLLRDARDGGRLSVEYKGKKSSGPVIVSPRASDGVGAAKYVSFQMGAFEGAVLSRLREIDPREIQPDDTSGETVLALSGRLLDAEGKIERLKAKMVGDDDIGPLVDVMRTLEDERRAAADQLAAAKQEAATPLSDAWGACRGLVEALAAAPDQTDARTRLRAVLRRIVSEIWCLFVERGRTRVAAVQVWFEGGRHRDYLIVQKPAYTSRPAKATGKRTVLPSSWSVVDEVFPGGRAGFDLRNRRHASSLEKVLASVEL